MMMEQTNESKTMRRLLALGFMGGLAAASAHAAVVQTSSDYTRSATTTSSSLQFFKLRQDKPTVVEVSGTGSGTLKVGTAIDDSPTTSNGFVPDPDGTVTSNTGWVLPSGLLMLIFEPTSGTWVVRVAQPK